MAVRVMTIKANGISDSRLTDFRSTKARGKTVTSVMSFDKIIEQPSVTSAKAITRVRVLVTCCTKEWATNSSVRESIAAITARMLNRQARVCN